MFQVLAGPHQERFLVHADILCQSDKFRSTVRGGWQDSRERVIRLEDWDEDTVGRLVEWLYRKDYSAPFPKDSEPGLPQDPPPRRRDPGTYVDLQWTSSSRPVPITGGAGQSAEEPHCRPLESVAAIRFRDIPPQPQEPQHISFQQWLATHMTRGRTALDCEDVLFAHAKLYALAGYVLLPSLQALAFTRIQEVLALVEPIKPEMPLLGNIISLVRFIYSNTEPLANSQEPLRNLITTYIAQNHPAFVGEEVEALEEEGGDFVRDLAAKAKQNVAYLQQQQAAMKNLQESVGSSTGQAMGLENGHRWVWYSDGTGRYV